METPEGYENIGTDQAPSGTAGNGNTTFANPNYGQVGDVTGYEYPLDSSMQEEPLPKGPQATEAHSYDVPRPAQPQQVSKKSHYDEPRCHADSHPPDEIPTSGYETIGPGLGEEQESQGTEWDDTAYIPPVDLELN